MLLVQAVKNGFLSLMFLVSVQLFAVAEIGFVVSLGLLVTAVRLKTLSYIHFGGSPQWPGGVSAVCGGSQGRLLAARHRPPATLRTTWFNPCRGRGLFKVRFAIFFATCGLPLDFISSQI
jgi:hypothetical protein